MSKVNIFFLLLLTITLFICNLNASAEEDLQSYLMKARQYYNEGKTGDAISTLEKAIETDPKFTEAYFMLGNIYILEEKPEEGKEVFENLNKITPDDRRVLYLIAASDYLSYEYSEAQTNLEKILESNPFDIVSRNYLALILFRKGENSESLEEVIKAIKYILQGSGDFTLYSELEILFSDVTKITPTLEDIEEIAENNQENVNSHIILGWFSYNNDELEQAYKSFEKAVALDEKNVMACYLSGLVSYNLNDSVKALEEYEKALKLNEEFVKSIADNFQYVEGAKRNSQILEWEKKLSEEPENHSIMYQLAVYYYERNSFSQAEELMSKAVKINPDEGKYYNFLGEIYLKRYKTQDATDAFSRATEIDENNGEYWSNLCYACEKNGLFQESVDAGEKAIKLMPEAGIAYSSMAISLYYLKEYDRAIEIFKKAIEKDPENGELFCRYAIALQVKGYMKEAALNYKKSIELLPDLFDSYYQLACTMMITGDYKEASLYFNKALSMRTNYRSIYTPDFNDALINLARTALKKDEPEEAIKYLDVAISEDPLKASAHLYKACAYEKLNESEKADEEFTRVYYLISVSEDDTFIEKFAPYSENQVFLPESRPVTAYSITMPERWTPLEMGGPQFVLPLPDRGEKELEEEIEKDFDYSSTIELVKLYLYEKNPEKAAKLLETVPQGEIDDRELHNLKGIIYTLERKTELALIEFNKALKIAPENYEIHNNIGVFYLELKNYGMAAEHLKKSLKCCFFNSWAYNNLGLIYLEQENYIDAEEAFFFAKASDLKSPWVRHNLGWTYYKLDKVEDAIKEMEYAIELKPEEAIFYSHLGWIYLEKGDPENALKYYNKSLKTDPSLAGTYNTTGVIYMEQNNYNEALKNFKKAIELSPDEERYQRNLGIAYYKLNRFDLAEEVFEKAIELNPYSTENHLNLCSTLSMQGRLEEGDRYLNDAMYYNEHDYSPVNEIIITCNQGALYLDQGKVDLSEKQFQTIINYRETYKGLEKYLFSYYIDAYNNMGLLKYKQGLTDEAEEMLRESKNLLENYPPTLNNLAFVTEGTDKEKAKELYEKAIEGAPENGLYYNNLACLYFKEGNREKAKEIIFKGLEKSQETHILMYNLGGIYFSENLMEESLKTLKSIPQNSPIAPETNYLMGLIYYKQGKTILADERFRKALSQKKLLAGLIDSGWTFLGINAFRLARDKFEKAITVSPDKSDGYIGLATYYFNTGDMLQAQEEVERAMKIEPGNEKAFIIMSLIHYKKGDYEKSIKELEKAIEINPENNLAWYNYGYMQQEHGDHDKAIEAYEKVITLGENELVAICASGFIYYFDGEYKEAKASAYQVIQNDPSFSDAYYILAKVAEREKNTEEAIFEYKRVLEADPLHVEAAEALKRLEDF